MSVIAWLQQPSNTVNTRDHKSGALASAHALAIHPRNDVGKGCEDQHY
jgi:hypothetical protein